MLTSNKDKEVDVRPPCPRCGAMKIYSQGRNWACQGCGSVFPKTPRVINRYKKDLGERPQCPICGARNPISRGISWSCRECGRTWPKKPRVEFPMVDSIKECGIKQPLGLTSPPKEVITESADKTLVGLWDQHLDPQKEIHPSSLLASQYVYDTQPDIIILGGDLLEFGSVSAWDKKTPLLMEGKRYKLDIEMGKRYLGELRNRCPNAEIHFLAGNHENRVDRYVEQEPKVVGLMDVRKDLGIDGFGIKWSDYNKIIRIGKLCYLHGQKYNKFFAQTTLAIVGESCAFGHAHRYQIWAQRLRFDQEAHVAIGVPALSSQNPEWKRGEHTDWANGFLVVEYRKGGFFNANVVMIIDGAFTRNNRTWRIK